MHTVSSFRIVENLSDLFYICIYYYIFLTFFIHKRVKEITGGGAHAVLVVNASRKSYAQAPSFLRIGGQLVCVGIPGEATPLNLDARTIIGKDLRILAGSVVWLLFYLSIFYICFLGDYYSVISSINAVSRLPRFN
jgi:D-arabinose 1-dehydrogenase-like Zn-dependent alcohol dehydrogenase